jgi:SSS family solute:Na+ symporter
VTVGVSLATVPKPIEELQGLVYGMANEPGRQPRSERGWFRRPQILAGGILALTAGLSLMFI